MKLNLKVKEENYVELEIEGEDHTLPNALKEILLENDDVEFAAYIIEHPEATPPKLIVRAKKNPMPLIKDAVKQLAKQAADFKAAMKKAKEK